MFNKAKKDKEKAINPAIEEKDGAMEELGDEELGSVSGAGDPFANHPRVSNKNINDTVRKNG